VASGDRVQRGHECTGVGSLRAVDPGDDVCDPERACSGGTRSDGEDQRAGIALGHGVAEVAQRGGLRRGLGLRHLHVTLGFELVGRVEGPSSSAAG